MTMYTFGWLPTFGGNPCAIVLCCEKKCRQTPRASGGSGFGAARYNPAVRRFLPLPLAAIALLLNAQTARKFALTIDNIMRGPNLVGYEPAQVRWSGDSRQIYFEWKQASQKEDEPMDTYAVNRDGTGLHKLSEEEAKAAPPAAGDVSPDRGRIVYARQGDVFLYDNTSGQTRQLTRTTEVESNPRFLRDGKRIALTRGNNLYVLSLEDGSLVQMTDIRSEGAPAAGAPAGGGRGGRGGAPSPTGQAQPGTPSQEFLKKEEKDLLEVIRERAARREEEEARRKKENPRQPFTLAARESVASLELSPDETFVTAAVTDAPANAKNTIVPNYVTESAYTEDIPGRSNVGDAQPRVRLAIIDVATGEEHILIEG